MNIPIQELIDAITALTAATERNSAIAQKALDLHLSAASHLPTTKWADPDPDARYVVAVDTATPETGIPAVDAAPAKKTRAKKADALVENAIVTAAQVLNDLPLDTSSPEALVESLKTAPDFYTEKAAEANNVPVAEVTPEQRHATKAQVLADSYAAPQPTEPPVTVETIRAYIGQYMLPVTNVTGEALEAAQANNAAITAKVKEINAEFGATRIPDVPTERLAEYLTVIKRWIPLNK